MTGTDAARSWSYIGVSFTHWMVRLNEEHFTLNLSKQCIRFRWEHANDDERRNLIDMIVQESIDPGATQNQLSQKQLLVARAKQEMDKDFPLLHEHSVVAVWSLLEATIDDFLTAWLRTRPDLLIDDKIGTVKVPLNEFIDLDKEDQTRLIVRALSDRPNRKAGVDGFESDLKLIGIEGSISADLRKTLIEMHQVRNVIVHKQGIADARLVRACGWLRVSVGRKILIDGDRCTRYHNAASAYVLSMMVRTAAYFGIDVPTHVFDPSSHAAEGAQ